MIQTSAKNTIGYSSEALETSLKSVLNVYQNLDNQIDEIETKIEEIYNTLDCHIHTIKGISTLTSAGILAKIANFDRFSSLAQILAFAGLEPAKIQSGTMNVNGKMVKHGSSYLRHYLMTSAETFYVHNPIISDFYRKKRNEGKTHFVTLSHVARKLVNVIFYLEKHKQDFDPNLVK